MFSYESGAEKKQFFLTIMTVHMIYSGLTGVVYLQKTHTTNKLNVSQAYTWGQPHTVVLCKKLIMTTIAFIFYYLHIFFSQSSKYSQLVSNTSTKYRYKYLWTKSAFFHHNKTQAANQHSVENPLTKSLFVRLKSTLKLYVDMSAWIVTVIRISQLDQHNRTMRSWSEVKV